MSQPQIAIVDYQAGNVRSVQKALEKFGARAIITDDAGEIERSDALVFPGQGANDSSMRELKARKLIASIKDFIASGKPFFGVCLGFQLLLEESDEGKEPGLGLLLGRSRRLPEGVKVPHMGWNQVKFHIEHPVLAGIPSDSHFYFGHSYYANPEDNNMVAGTTTYGVEFCSAIAWENIVATQFHPEKSGVLGLKMYQNFVSVVEKSRTVGAWKSSRL